MFKLLKMGSHVDGGRVAKSGLRSGWVGGCVGRWVDGQGIL